jgi:hypothetical protein
VTSSKPAVPDLESPNRPVWVAVLACFFGAVFVFSALTKGFTIEEGNVRRSPFFELMLVKQTPLETRQAAAVATRLIVALELFIGLMFFQTSFLRRSMVPLTACILVAFTLYLVWLMIYDPDAEDCGCFGEMIAMTPAVSIGKNLLLLLFLLPIYRFADSAKRATGIPLAMGAFALGFAIFTMPTQAETAVPPPEDGGPAPSKFAVFETLENGDATLQLTEGIRIAALLSLDCDHCQFVALQLGETYDLFEPAKIGFVFLGEEDAVPDFLGQINTDLVIPYTIPSAITFFDFTGDKPPRVYLLQEGKTVKYWDTDDFDLGLLEEAVKGLEATPSASPEPSSEGG